MDFLNFMELQEAAQYRLDEKAGKFDYIVHHDSFTSAVGEARRIAELKGFELDEEDWSNYITFGDGRPKSGKTFKATIGLFKNGKELKKPALHIQVYNRETERNTYELNTYIL